MERCALSYNAAGRRELEGRFYNGGTVSQKRQTGWLWSKDMNSFNHYASIGKWMYEVCAGLKRDERKPGYQHFYVEPQPGGNYLM